MLNFDFIFLKHKTERNFKEKQEEFFSQSTFYSWLATHSIKTIVESDETTRNQMTKEKVRQTPANKPSKGGAKK